MSNHRGTDGSSSPSVERKDKDDFSLSNSNHLSRDNNLRARDETDHLTGEQKMLFIVARTKMRNPRFLKTMTIYRQKKCLFWF